ncbi:hypothetical protein BD324DRAFT_612691 [Kockovaella imperatae]|uniref:DUF1014-domain-containing protein n=1 Tax=Kockovaella imperatae TaxID=4999 RepID=A0A1Y1USH1_9TREE|nr:hypothetical protein BD324DRAFT_612691 [Kockovaella imperatae]ORX40961.1 hypothetical protein BD324DRAFT_612691 [Kockovaella imperatae]
MPPSKNNTKKESGRAKKAENEEKKSQAAAKAQEAKEAEKWKDGAKGTTKADLAAVKAAEQAKKKAEKEALLAAEEASMPSKPKAAPKAGAKKKPTTDKPLLAPGGGIANYSVNDPLGLRRSNADQAGEGSTTALSATGVEDMLEALELANQKTDKDTMGAKAGLIERHPERRFKAAFEAYLEREMPRIREDYPGLRQNQYRDRLFKEFEKHPDNPFNQAQVAYNATKDERVDALKQVMDAREAKYRVEQ